VDIGSADGNARHGDVLKRIQIWIWGILLFADLTMMPAKGDGGRVQMHERAGPFIVTLFSVPDTLVTGPADLSVGVEDADTSELVNDAEVKFTLSQRDTGSPHGIVARATHGSSASGIFQTAQVTFPNAGRWQITIDVNRKGTTGQCSTDLRVDTPHQRAYDIWAAAAAPLMVCLLFAIHEWRKRKWERERTIRIRAS
jgi:hypothetical protein